MIRYEYRTAISDGPLSANQLTNEFGADGWELVDIVQHEHQGKMRFWNYFKRDRAPVAPVLSVVGRSNINSPPLRDRWRGPGASTT